MKPKKASAVLGDTLSVFLGCDNPKNESRSYGTPWVTTRWGWGGNLRGWGANCHARALRVRCVRHIVRHTQLTSFSGSIIGMSLKVSKELQCDCCGFCQYTILTYQACLYCCMFTSCSYQTIKIERGGAQSYAKCCAHPRGTVAPFWCTLWDGKVI